MRALLSYRRFLSESKILKRRKQATEIILADLIFWNIWNLHLLFTVNNYYVVTAELPTLPSRPNDPNHGE